MRRIVLIHTRSPGDIVCLTPLVRDIHLTYPGQFEIDVDTSCKELWQNNPHLTPLRGKKIAGTEYIKITYGQGLNDSRRETVHFCGYFHRDFEKQCGVKVPLQLPYGDLHLSEEEKNVRPVTGRYWVLISGGKSDFTIKVWQAKKFQEVTDRIRSELGISVVQIGDTAQGHWHPPMDGAINLIGRTNLRDTLRLIHHADGVICGVTFAMHAAAALHRPCVVLAGGREPWWWEAYDRRNAGLGNLATANKLIMPHRFLHTIGLLDCCQHCGCWRNKVVKISEDKSICQYPIMYPEQPVAKCMAMIDADHVMEAIMSYYSDNSLPPITVRQSAMIPKERVILPASEPPARARRLDIFADVPAVAADNADRTGPALPPLAAIVPTAITRENPQPIIVTRPGVTHSRVGEECLDNPDVGGKYTICVLLYDEDNKHHDMHRRCLEGIINSVPPERMDLRVGSNCLGPKSLQMMAEYQAAGLVTEHYAHVENAFKYPVMREMFHDPANPITTPWVIWFDDDSIVNDAGWLLHLSQVIAQKHQKENVHMLGSPFTWQLLPGQKSWYEQATWYKQKPWRNVEGKPAPNGDRIVFCTGGWWAISAEAIQTCDIPDVRLMNNGGDFTIGEQLYQGGLQMTAFNTRKHIINTSSAPRRGVTHAMPGTSIVIPPKPNTSHASGRVPRLLRTHG